MTKTSIYTRRLVQKLICLLVLVSSTHQVAQAVVTKDTKAIKSSPKSCKAKSCRAYNSKATTQHSDTYLCSSGNAGDPIPLGECEGDCNNDDNCEEGLNCRKNGDEDTVPGCEGCASGGMNYCYARPADSSDGVPYLWFVARKEEGDETFSLGKCEGDCDTDSDCDEGLNCRRREDGDEDTVPGCEGKASGGKDYCYARPADSSDGVPYLWFVARKEEGDETFSLGECEGDCNLDTDCKGALNCRLREDGDEDTVPGCEGKASRGKDYCYARPADSSDGVPYLWFVADKVEEDEILSLGKCEGDCDKDTDCDEGLNCWQRNDVDEDTVPGCEGKASGKKDYCYARPPAVTPGGLPYLWIYNKKVMFGKCEGDCNKKDENCEGNLKCFKRNNVDDLVPGCVGIASKKKDYCYEMPLAA